MQTKAIERAGIGGTAAGTGKSSGGGIGGFPTADGLMDTLDVNCYGATDLQTPHMDGLAKTGVRFTQAYAHTVCCPSRAGLMTGRHPQRGGVNGWIQGDRNGSDARLNNMAATEITIAETLKAAGYDTALFGKWIGNKGTFLEGGVRVPAIISYPKVLPQNVVRDQAVTVMDWFPTILELAEIPEPDVVLDGRSMLPVIKDISAPSAHPVLYFQWKRDWAVRQGVWKLIARKGRSKVTVTLHNLSDEKPEKQNYAAAHPEIVERLRKLHAEWNKEVTPK